MNIDLIENQNSLKLGGLAGIGGGFLGLEFFFLSLSSVDVSISLGLLLFLPMLLIFLIVSLSPLKELETLRFLRGGRDGGGNPFILPAELPPRLNEDLDETMAFVIAELLAILMQLIPFRFLGRRDF